MLLDALGLDRAEFTPTFAVGRTAGWTAHVEEQRATGRLIRPASVYVGPRPDPSGGDLHGDGARSAEASAYPPGMDDGGQSGYEHLGDLHRHRKDGS